MGLYDDLLGCGTAGASGGAVDGGSVVEAGLPRDGRLCPFFGASLGGLRDVGDRAEYLGLLTGGLEAGTRVRIMACVVG